MDINFFKKEYLIGDAKNDLLNQIEQALLDRNVDDITISDCFIEFSNNFFSFKRNNWSLMSYIDSGCFEIVQNGDISILIITFSMRRTFIILVIAVILVLGLNSDNILIGLLMSLVFSVNVFFIYFRYRLFIKKVIRICNVQSH